MQAETQILDKRQIFIGHYIEVKKLSQGILSSFCSKMLKSHTLKTFFPRSLNLGMSFQSCARKSCHHFEEYLHLYP